MIPADERPPSGAARTVKGKSASPPASRGGHARRSLVPPNASATKAQHAPRATINDARRHTDPASPNNQCASSTRAPAGVPEPHPMHPEQPHAEPTPGDDANRATPTTIGANRVIARDLRDAATYIARQDWPAVELALRRLADRLDPPPPPRATTSPDPISLHDLVCDKCGRKPNALSWGRPYCSDCPAARLPARYATRNNRARPDLYPREARA